MKKLAKRILNASTAEIEDLRNCPDCYINRDQANPAAVVCAKPHLVLWVKFGGHPYWPAKLLKVGKDNSPLEVHFFGEFSSAAVTYTDCYLYTYADPNSFVGDIKKVHFLKAIDVSHTESILKRIIYSNH